MSKMHTIKKNFSKPMFNEILINTEEITTTIRSYLLLIIYY